MTGWAKIAGALLSGAVVLVAMFWLGRSTGARGPSASSASATSDAYFAGLRAGEAQGRQEGRALQEGAELRPGERNAVHRAFEAGYAAGANDVFAGYDGGWARNVPWIITLDAGSGPIVYRIRAREQLARGTEYYLCADGRSVCHARR
jgi:hypothetical protein